MPRNYGFFIRILIRREKREKAKGQINQWIERLNGKENGEEKWIKLPLNLLPKPSILIELYFHFLPLKLRNVRTLVVQVQGLRN